MAAASTGRPRSLSISDLTPRSRINRANVSDDARSVAENLLSGLLFPSQLLGKILNQ